MSVMMLAGLLSGYLLGAIPFGLILSYASGAGDIRQIGSGNIGATNVLRTGRRWLAAATLLLDAAKGAGAVLIMTHFAPTGVAAHDPATGSPTVLAAAVGVLLGHCFPVWLGFRGGKGVATLLGVCLALAWPVGLIYAAVWLVVLQVTRISSAAGISAALAAPLAAWSFGSSDSGDRTRMTAVLAGLAALVVWLHRANIARLKRGSEPRIGRKAATGPSDS